VPLDARVRLVCDVPMVVVMERLTVRASTLLSAVRADCSLVGRLLTELVALWKYSVVTVF